MPVRIENPHTKKHEDVYALIDTGADASIIPGPLAEKLGHDLQGDQVATSFTYGVGEGKVCAYQHTFVLNLISSRSTRKVWCSGPILVDCVEHEIPVILGVQGMLQNFRVTLNYPKREAVLHW